MDMRYSRKEGGGLEAVMLRDCAPFAVYFFLSTRENISFHEKTFDNIGMVQ